MARRKNEEPIITQTEILAMAGRQLQQEIIAHFDTHEDVPYTAAVFELLQTEPDCWAITDRKTGEVLWQRDAR